MNHAALDRQEDTFWQGLIPQLTELTQLTSTSFNKLAEVVANKKSFLVLPNLDQALHAATQQVEQLQKIAGHNYSVEETLRFASFFYSMEAIAIKLKSLSDCYRRK